MAENTGISWAHNTWNPWVGCDKIAPECAHCYIDRVLRRQPDGHGGKRKPWGEIYRTKTWNDPCKWEAQAANENVARRVFTCSLSDFFHADADPWRDEAWAVIKYTPHLVWLVLTKRPDRIHGHLPSDWGQGYPNVWLGVSTGCNATLNKMDTLRKIPCAVRWISSEPLLEDISQKIDLDGFHWVVTGGESGSGKEYVYEPNILLKKQLNKKDGRRTMLAQWALNLRDKTKASGLPFMFKQVTNPTSGYGYNALDGKDWHEFPPAPNGLKWGARQPITEKYAMTPIEWQTFMHRLPL
jgi:protein gp37